MEFEIKDSINPKTRLSLVMNPDDDPIIYAEDERVLKFRSDGSIFMYASARLKELGFKTNADGEVKTC